MPLDHCEVWNGCQDSFLYPHPCTSSSRLGLPAHRPDRQVCAHNGKEFDFPYLGRRYLIQGLPLPGFLVDLQSKKPWEVRVLDTMQIWKFGDYKSFTSLDLLCAVLGVPSPKEDMDGSMVGRVYWEEGDHAKIAAYCERDVLATAQVMLRMSGAPLIAEEDVAHAP